MKNMYKLLLFIFLIPLAVTATKKEGKYTKNKAINKEFSVSKNATLKVSNKFGNIDIVTWNENKISIKVSITTNGNNEENVKKRLEQIDVEFDATNNSVEAKTMIAKTSSSWNLWGKKNNVRMEINYLIKMPITNNVDLSNDYGAINLDKLEGSSKINCDYGKLNIGELLNSNNRINIDYTNKSIIEFMKDGDINADYSTLHIEKSGNTKLNADYSHISFEKVNALNYNCDYGSLKINESGKLTGNSDYMHTTVKKMNGSGNFNIDYGSLKVGELGSNFNSFIVDASYTHVKIGLTNTVAFNINSSTSYSGFKYNDGFTFTKEIKKNQSKYYEGYYNNSTSGNTINIKASYGSITFINN